MSHKFDHLITSQILIDSVALEKYINMVNLDMFCKERT